MKQLNKFNWKMQREDNEDEVVMDYPSSNLTGADIGY